MIIIKLIDVFPLFWVFGVYFKLGNWQNMLFNNYKDASEYAKTRAKKLGYPIKILRQNDVWAVNSAELTQPQQSYAQYSTQKEHWKQVQEKREFERKEKELLAQEYQEQKAYEDAIQSHTPQTKVIECEACGRPVSFCRCGN